MPRYVQSRQHAGALLRVNVYHFLNLFAETETYINGMFNFNTYQDVQGMIGFK